MSEHEVQVRVVTTMASPYDPMRNVYVSCSCGRTETGFHHDVSEQGAREQALAKFVAEHPEAR